MLPALIAIGLFGLLGPAHPGAGDKASRHTVDGWRVSVLTDRFTGARRCELQRGPMSVAHNAVVFHLGADTDTFDAVYRLDGGAAAPASALRVDLVKSGYLFEHDSLANSSGGEVAIPLAVIGHTAKVYIRPSRKADARVFDLRGMGPALAYAGREGCDPASAYSKG